MMRWLHLANAILANYAGTEATFLQAEDRYAYADATNRVVAYPTDGLTQEPQIAAQGGSLADLEPCGIRDVGGSGIDDIVWERQVNVTFEIWAPDDAAAENRLHAFLIAIADTCNSALRVSNIREQWPASNGQITQGGAQVLLYATLTIYVLRSDSAVLSDGAPIGSGTPVAAVTATEITPELDGEELAPSLQETET